jgi:hypothetical protein
MTVRRADSELSDPTPLAVWTPEDTREVFERAATLQAIAAARHVVREFDLRIRVVLK